LEEFRAHLIETDYSRYEMNKDPFLENKAEKVLGNIRDVI